MIIAPKIKTASNPSLKIIEKDEMNAIIGAMVPVPETRRSDSSRERSREIIVVEMSSIGAPSLI